jgi:hypothetical protein
MKDIVAGMGLSLVWNPRGGARDMATGAAGLGPDSAPDLSWRYADFRRLLLGISKNRLIRGTTWIGFILIALFSWAAIILIVRTLTTSAGM